MIKVLYIFLDSTKSSGVLKKVKSKIKLLNGNGIEAQGIFINKNILEYHYNKDEKIAYVPFKVPKTPFFFNRRYIRNFKKKFEYNNWYKHLYKTLDIEVSKFDFDILLFRYPLSNKYLLRFVKEHSGKVVFEHNSKELIELSLNPGGKTTDTYLQEEEYGSKVLKYAKALTGVGKEITTYEVKRSGVSNKPSAVISNSIEVSTLKQRNIPELNGKDYNLLYLTGSPSPWVGIDIVIRSLAEHQSSNKNVKLFIVGPKLDSLVKMVNELNLSDRVVFEGEKQGEELDEYFNRCHIAFGTMAMQRVGLKEHSSLKILEYASRGMPFIIGYDDTNFVNTPEFSPYYRILNYNGTSININEVISFADKLFQDKEHPRLMRELSFKYLDTIVKMNQLRDFIQSLESNES